MLCISFSFVFRVIIKIPYNYNIYLCKLQIIINTLFFYKKCSIINGILKQIHQIQTIIIGGFYMSKLISIKETKLQNKQIVCEINELLNKIAYDGRVDLNVRFRKIKNTSNQYLIEAKTIVTCNKTVIRLEHNPFGLLWFIISKRQIKKGTLLAHCRRSRYGGYSFY